MLIINPPQILLDNVRLHLVEDRPPVNATSPGAVPLDLCIGRMRVTRDAAGVVGLQPLQPVAATAATDADDDATTGAEATATAAERGRDREVLALQLVMQQLKLDNEHLKWQMRLNEKSAENVM